MIKVYVKMDKKDLNNYYRRFELIINLQKAINANYQ
jgi:hypothetical protein